MVVGQTPHPTHGVSSLHPSIPHLPTPLSLSSTAYHNLPPGLSSPLGNSSALPPTQAPETPQPRPFRLESLGIPFTKTKRKKSKSSFGREPL